MRDLYGPLDGSCLQELILECPSKDAQPNTNLSGSVCETGQRHAVRSVQLLARDEHPIFDADEILVEAWVVDRLLVLILRHQVLFRDIGDIGRLLDRLREEVKKWLVFLRPHIFGDTLVPFFSVVKGGIGVKDNAPEPIDPVADGHTDPELGIHRDYRLGSRPSVPANAVSSIHGAKSGPTPGQRQ